MRKIWCSKQYSGIFWAIITACAFVAISLWGAQFLSGVPWYIFSSALRFIFGFMILFIINKLYGRPLKDVLSTKRSKAAFIAGNGFVIFFIYYLLVWCSGITAIKGLTIGLFLSKIILQQIATGFYEELNYRVLVLEGYFHGTQNTKRRLIYGFLSFLLFAAVHVVDGWSISRFLLSGAIGFSFAVMYLKSRNILLPMLFHFIYDIFANFTSFIEWNQSPVFVNLNSISDIVLIIMFVISFIMLLTKGKDNSD